MPGSIEKRGKGKYLLVVSNGTGADGKRKKFTKMITAESDADAEKQLAIYYADVMRGKIRDDNNITFKEYCDYWIEKKVKKSSPKTISRYKELLDRITFSLGHIRLSKLKPRHLADFYDMLRQDGIRGDGKTGGLSETTIAHHHRLIHTVLESARKVDQLISENPADNLTDPPKFGKMKAKYYQDDQVVQLLECLSKEPIKYRTFITITIFVGNRRGEALGLEWLDIDEQNCIIRIQRASYYTKSTGIYESSPKTEDSIREIVVPPDVIMLLKAYKIWWNKQKLKKGWQDTNRLFVQNDGKPMHPDTPTKWFRKFLKKYDLPPITLHQLRHTNASLLIAAGVDLITIAERLGHADKSTTVKVYSHMLEKSNQKAADALASSLLKKPI